MKAAIYANTASHQQAWATALRRGLERHGVAARVVPPGQAAEADFVACWGWRNGKPQHEAGRRVLVMERGYIGDRFKWTSLAWNGLNGRGKVPPVDDCGARWRKHFAGQVGAWKETGDCALVMGQVPGDMSLAGVDIQAWYGQALRAAERFGLPVLFRPHPVAAARGARLPPGAKALGGELAAALARARYVLTFNSNSGVDAVLAGVPSIVCDEGSMAWPVAGHGLDAEPPEPDRTTWCASIAWRQWLLEEIASGEAWDYLKGGL